MRNASTPAQNQPYDDLSVEVLTNDEFTQRQADRLMQSTIGSDANSEKVGTIISRFVQSYEQHKATKPLDTWLVDEFKQYPTIWRDEQEIVSTAHEVIDTVQERNDAYQSLLAHVDAGKSKESWLATKIEQGAKAAGVTNVGIYAANIETAVNNANQQMHDTLTTRAGDISQAFNLDGFAAEQSHVDSFNLEAAAKGSEFRAKALTPEAGETFGKNSMDVGIYDGKGKLVKRYQFKYGKDADSTQTLFDKGDYRGQRKVVPSEQVNDIANSTDRIEHNGIESKPLSKQEAKQIQNKAQQAHEIKQYEWNDVNRTQIATHIGKQALVAAGMTAAFQGARIVGRRLWNKLTGKGNPPASEDLKEFFSSSIRSAGHLGAQVAVSGAVVVAAKSGWMGAVVKNTPAKHIATAVHAGLENAKILSKWAKGELSATEALDKMGQLNTSLIGGVFGATMGAAQGAVIGATLGPVGAFIGGVVGGVVGGIAGSAAGEMMYNSWKKTVSTGVSVVKSVGSAVASVGRSIVSGFRSLFS